jgi:hypothetical protein
MVVVQGPPAAQSPPSGTQQLLPSASALMSAGPPVPSGMASIVLPTPQRPGLTQQPSTMLIQHQSTMEEMNVQDAVERQARESESDEEDTEEEANKMKENFDMTIQALLSFGERASALRWTHAAGARRASNAVLRCRRLHRARLGAVRQTVRGPDERQPPLVRR